MTLADGVLARGDVWRHIIVPPRLVVAHERFDEDDFSQASKSKRVISDGAICGLIREAEVMVATRQWSFMYCSRGGGSGAADNNGYSG